MFWPQLPKFLTHRPVGESWFNCKHLSAHFWADLAARLSHFWKDIWVSKVVLGNFAKYHFQHVRGWWCDSGSVIIVNINNHFPYDSPFRTDKCQINFGMMHRWTWKKWILVQEVAWNSSESLRLSFFQTLHSPSLDEKKMAKITMRIHVFILRGSPSKSSLPFMSGKMITRLSKVAHTPSTLRVLNAVSHAFFGHFGGRS